MNIKTPELQESVMRLKRDVAHLENAMAELTSDTAKCDYENLHADMMKCRRLLDFIKSAIEYDNEGNSFLHYLMDDESECPNCGNEANFIDRDNKEDCLDLYECPKCGCRFENLYKHKYCGTEIIKTGN